MSELLPGRQATRLRDGLLDYLTTTFALANAPARAALRDFLADEDDGMFKGPYLRTGMPFSPAPRRAISPLDWMPSWFTPYAHQAAAFSRLSSRNGRPQPTLVTTGTGSGKTEAFLLPILDHCLRERRAGRSGMKALILYPMNALANDQAQRLATLITSTEPDGSQPLAGITAALYTGEAREIVTKVTAADPERNTPASLITDRAIIRDEAPDILLTNYKMLDQLLLRAEDQRLWQQSANSLTYLVLDEFHTYDGAQGTDVAMLLRRLGFALKSHWPHRGSAGDSHSSAEWDRPLGRITPVGTSATLGPGDDGVSPRRSVVDFATRVFGETFDETSVVSEQRRAPEDWAADPRPVSDEAIRLRRDPYVTELLENTRQARHVNELADLLDDRALQRDKRVERLLEVFDKLGHLRATNKDGGPDRSMPSTEVHLWLREVTRLDRYADTAARFRWGDDGATTGEQDATGATSIAFPAIYCRGCGRSGWGVELAPIGTSLAASDSGIRRNHASQEGRFRALLNAPDGDGGGEGVMWFDPHERCLDAKAPEADADVRQGRVLRVVTHTGPEADELSSSDTCPSCHQRDAIRFVGSAIATLMSVSIATLFGEPGLADGEKKALVFTDSVQDAAHRAGFVSARSHTLTMRSVWRAAGDRPKSLPELVDEVFALAGDDPFRRYRIVPPSIRDDLAARYWRDTEPAVTEKLRKRLLLDAALEFGLVGGFGRTLERTASMSAQVNAGESARLVEAARAVLADADLIADQTSDTDLIAWVRGVLERMRTQGAILHPWLESYLDQDGARWQIWGGRPHRDWMPAFPKGRTAPAFPRVGKALSTEPLLDAVTSPQSWYASWTRRCFQLNPTAAANLAKLLLDELAKRGTLTKITTRSGASVYGIAMERIVVAPCQDEDVANGAHLLRCAICHSEFPASTEVSAQLTDAPCLAAACTGTLRRQGADVDNYYRRIYDARDARRVNAREHTSLLDPKVRLAYENGFKRSTTDPAAPNVLVATPTLEMGIDIGDLSSVFLASLPRTVANYVQRVGRAGRLSGNALNVAFAQGGGEFLPRLGEPLSLINGAVTPPATYLSAEEILRRQWLAHVADELARDPGAIHPRTAKAALALPGAQPTYLGQLIERSGKDVEQRFARFVGAFRTDGVGESALRGDAIESLGAWVRSGGGITPLAATVAAAAARWHQERQETEQRLDELVKRVPELETRAKDSDDDARALRETQAEIRFLGGVLGQASGDYWIGALERLGLLPNYSLVDDSVQLDVTMSWIDEDGAYKAEQADYTRGRAQALSDFAPGATFYAHGLQIAIDAVDIGRHGAGIRTVRLCPECGYVAENGASPTTCPRCGDIGIADVGQKFETVELNKVSAYIRRDEARIDDREDERARTGFTLLPTADLDPNRVVNSWFTSTDTGVKYMRGIDVRWFNLGPRRHTAPDVRIAGLTSKAPQFRVCAGCGHLDKAGLSNSREEHRPWCSLRTSPTEQTRTVLLHRQLVTEGALIRLPYSATLGDDPFALPSLSAALVLGMREVYGGAPEHLAVIGVSDPASNNRRTLLAYDSVPGGTGYLAELGDHRQLWQILARALDILRSCRCAEEERLSCHRCLLPFAMVHQREWTSRSSAIKHLETMLGVESDAPTTVPTWEIVNEPLPETETESVLESRFRMAFRTVAERLGGTITDIPGMFGNTIRVSLGNRAFTLASQVSLGHTKPDFLLSSEQLPDIAIYTDGWAFHASPEHNRISDDAHKREVARLKGTHVLAVTSRDLDAFDRGTKLDAPGWFSESLAQKLNSVAELQHNIAARDALVRGPMEFIAYWLQQTDVDNLTRFGRTASALVAWGGNAKYDEYGAEAAALLGVPESARVWRQGNLAIAVEQGAPGAMKAVAVLDDTMDLDTAEAKQGWAAWLAFANATMFLPPSLVRVAARSEASALTVAPVEIVHATSALSFEWQPFVDELGAEALTLLEALAIAGVAPPDAEVGHELGDGVPFDLVWTTERIAVQVDLGGEVGALAVDGWRIFGADPDQIIEAWKESVHG